MKTTKIALLSLICFCVYNQGIAQHFVPPVSTYSHQKVSYLYLEDGTEVIGTIKDLDRKKGQLEEVKILDQNDKKVNFEGDEIAYMYLPPSGLDKFASATDFMNDATQWGKTDLDADILGKEYVYLEKSEVRVKKKTFTLMMQVVNPTFCELIRVYHDPLASETMSVGVAGITVVGGLDKSYYVKKAGDEVAFIVEKKSYDEQFKLIFSDCPELIAKYKEGLRWADFPTHVWEYAQLCGQE
ncbi:MAG: hypothetical protein KDC34_04150 [Saprospiraceae bacterium]|nr:hypothetical protein [Saprospiraceae bacterium]